jgi:hypothetical protein
MENDGHCGFGSELGVETLARRLGQDAAEKAKEQLAEIVGRERQRNDKQPIAQTIDIALVLCSASMQDVFRRSQAETFLQFLSTVKKRAVPRLQNCDF